MAKALPYDAEIEYLESSGTQWIDTGIIPDADTGISIDFYRLGDTQSAGALYIFGVTETNKRFYGIYRVRPEILQWGYKTTVVRDNTNCSIPFGTKIAFKLNYLNNKQAYLSTTDYTWEISSDGDAFEHSIDIFRANNSDTYPLFRGRIYGFKITQGSEMVMDLIPVRVGQVGYMYDKVSGQLLGNSGSGEFILGQDI